MRTKHLCVLIFIGIKDEVGTVKHVFKPSSNFITHCSKWMLLFGYFLLFMFHVYLCYAVLSVPCSIVITCWERADLLALLCVMFSCVFVTFSYGVPCQMWYFIVLIPDLCLFPYFVVLKDKKLSLRTSIIL